MIKPQMVRPSGYEKGNKCLRSHVRIPRAIQTCVTRKRQHPSKLHVGTSVSKCGAPTFQYDEFSDPNQSRQKMRKVGHYTSRYVFYKNNYTNNTSISLDFSC